MNPILIHPRAAILHGDASNLLTVLKPSSVDAIVTDPPAGVGFMGKKWDSNRGGRDAWIAWFANIMRGAYTALKPGGHALVWALPRTSHWTATALEDAGFDEVRDIVNHLFGQGMPKSVNPAWLIDRHLGHPHKSDAPAVTDEAKRYAEYGSGLKPAAEHWILVRKPLEGTYAEHVLKWGTGLLNVGACRLDPDAGDDEGRWPSNVILDESAAEELDALHGERRTGAKKSTDAKTSRMFANTGSGGGAEYHEDRPGSVGGVSRYFYVPKPSRAEKDAGCAHLAPRSGGEATGRVDGQAGLKNARAGAGRGGNARNSHPTVKGIELMRYLCRLVTPPGGLILDPFAGSGTTGVAALAEGFEFLGVEQGGDNGEYLPILKARIEHALATSASTPPAK